MAQVKVYLVGGPKAQQENTYEHMTNSLELAVELLQAIPQGQIKTITVQSNDTK